MLFRLKGNVYVIGGDVEGKRVAQVDRVNIHDGRITSVSPMGRPRDSAPVVASENYIFIFGGEANEDVKLSSCEKYDPTSDRWVWTRGINALLHFFVLLCTDWLYT